MSSGKPSSTLSLTIGSRRRQSNPRENALHRRAFVCENMRPISRETRGGGESRGKIRGNFTGRIYRLPALTAK